MNLWPWLGDNQGHSGMKEATPLRGDLTWLPTCYSFFTPLILICNVGRLFPALMIVMVFLPAAIG